jgi:hypothetical protein
MILQLKGEGTPQKNQDKTGGEKKDEFQGNEELIAMGDSPEKPGEEAIITVFLRFHHRLQLKRRSLIITQTSCGDSAE